MSKQDTMSDYSDDYDWDDNLDIDDQETEKERVTKKRASRKRNVKRRLDDYFESRRMRTKNRFLDSYDDDFMYQ